MLPQCVARGCNICDIAFASPDDLSAHARTSQRHERLTGIPPEERDYFCDICGIGNKTPEGLALHYSSDGHREAAGVPHQYSCDICDVGFRSSVLFREHLKSAEHRIAAGATPLGGGKDYRCEICKRGYGSDQSLRRHLLSEKHIRNKGRDDASSRHGYTESERDDFLGATIAVALRADSYPNRAAALADGMRHIKLAEIPLLLRQYFCERSSSGACETSIREWLDPRTLGHPCPVSDSGEDGGLLPTRALFRTFEGTLAISAKKDGLLHGTESARAWEADEYKEWAGTCSRNPLREGIPETTWTSRLQDIQTSGTLAIDEDDEEIEGGSEDDDGLAGLRDIECAVCGDVLSNISSLTVHDKTNKHRKMIGLSPLEGRYQCHICHIRMQRPPEKEHDRTDLYRTKLGLPLLERLNRCIP